MFGPRGNPQARNLFGVIGYLQKRDGLTLRVTTAKRAVRRAARQLLDSKKNGRS
jgi:hypothetical protein